MGIAAYDPQLCLGRIVNYLLPEPLKRETTELHPLVFGSVVIPAFLMSLFDKGATAERLIVKIADG